MLSFPKSVSAEIIYKFRALTVHSMRLRHLDFFIFRMSLHFRNIEYYLYLCLMCASFVAGITHSVQRLAIGWTAGVPVPVEARIFSSPSFAYRFWGPPSLLSNGYGGPFPGGKTAGA
jgi:hypothetical protein